MKFLEFILVGLYLQFLLQSYVYLTIFFWWRTLSIIFQISFMPFFIASIYFLADEKIFIRKKITLLFTLFLCLTIMTRLIEGITHLLIPLLVVLIFNKKISFYSSAKGLYPIAATWLLFYKNISKTL